MSFLQSCLETQVYYIQGIGEEVDFTFNGSLIRKYHVHDYVIESTTRYLFVLRSAVLVETSDGLVPKFFIKKYPGKYQIRMYSSNGKSSMFVAEYTDRFDAEEKLFDIIYAQYMVDDYRNRENFQTYDAAVDAQSSLYANMWSVNKSVAKSILRKKNIVEKLRRDRYKAHLQERESAETERINTQALQFIDLIEPQKETYEQTCARLKKAIGARIDQKVFHAAVRTIRFKYADTHK